MVTALIIVLLSLAAMELLARFIHFSKRGKNIKAILRRVLTLRLPNRTFARFASQARWMGIPLPQLHEIMAKACGIPAKDIERIYCGPDSFEQYEFRPFQGFHFSPDQKLSYTTIDSFGFQSTTTEFRKPSGVKRVVVLGGSVAFGIGASSGKAIWSHRLEQLLNENCQESSYRWEVINMAYVASNSHTELNRAIIYARMFNPDYVIHLAGFNDMYFFLESKKMYTFNFYNKIYTSLYQHPLGAFMRFLSEYSALILLLLKLYIKITNHTQHTSSIDRDMIYTVW